MSNPADHFRSAKHPVFLVDTPDYIGISRQFEPAHGLVTKKLRRDESLQQQWLSEQAIENSVEQLWATYSRLEIVIAGWVDQAVLEYHSILQGDQGCLAKMLDQLDTYRPGENGDLCFYLADLDYQQVLVTTFSFEDETISCTSYRRKRQSLR